MYFFFNKLTLADARKLVLREANQSTLESVTSFVQESQSRSDLNKIPSAFIITGANIASQELLFEQLSESLQEQADAKVVKLRSGDASNLKAALKKIIHSVTARESDEEGDREVAVGKDVSRNRHSSVDDEY